MKIRFLLAVPADERFHEQYPFALVRINWWEGYCMRSRRARLATAIGERRGVSPTCFAASTSG